MIAAVIVEKLKSTQRNKIPKSKAGVVCLFCEYERRNDQTMRVLVSAMLRQLADQCDELPLSVTRLYDEYKKNDAPLPFEKLSSALIDVLKEFPQVYLVVDALDECFESTSRDLMLHLLELQKESGMNILATSRLISKIQRKFRGWGELEIMADSQDVKNVLSALIEKSDSLIKADTELRDKVIENIAMAVQGMYVGYTMGLVVPSFH